MNKFICIFIFLVGIFTHETAIAADWNTPLHIGGSAALTMALYVCTTGPWADKQDKYVLMASSAAFAFAFGFALEVMDANGQRPLDAGDLEADAIGALSGALIIYLLDIKGAKPVPNGIAFRF